MFSLASMTSGSSRASRSNELAARHATGAVDSVLAEQNSTASCPGNQAREQLYISSVSVFEIALKASIGKLNIPFREFEVRLATSSGAQRLSLTWEHACRSYYIPTAHADPFDRLLLAQAIVEPLYLLSTDENLARYGGEFVMFVD